jgi:hypothetical protein
MKKFIVLLVTLIIVFQSPVVFAAGDDLNIIADLLIARPLGLVSLVIGSAVYIVSLPFVAFTQSGDEKVKKTFIEDPYHYTFKRPLGDIVADPLTRTSRGKNY